MRIILRYMIDYDGTEGSRRTAISTDARALLYARSQKIKPDDFVPAISAEGAGIDSWARSYRRITKELDKLPKPVAKPDPAAIEAAQKRGSTITIQVPKNCHPSSDGRFWMDIEYEVATQEGHLRSPPRSHQENKARRHAALAGAGIRRERSAVFTVKGASLEMCPIRVVHKRGFDPTFPGLI